MKKFLDKLAAKVAAHPREVGIALIVTSIGWAVAGFAFLVK
jgi:hypothetical protein